ncbi:MAG: efflux RND transporter periplasmic adaptor subunit [Thermodesulfobacteriota bacterium]
MAKRIVLTLVLLLLVVGAIAGVKFLQIRAMMAGGASFVPPPTVITATPVTSERWEETLTAVGTLEAVQGVTVAAEVPGKVVRIAFTAGASVRQGDLLLEQDRSAEEAQLRELQTSRALAATNLDRMARLVAEGFIAQVDYDNAAAAFKEAAAREDNIRAVIARKTIRAPFAGRLGIREVNLGQILREGDAVVSLQALDPIFVNFQLPQEEMPRLQPGLAVRLSGEGLGDLQPVGEISTVSPGLDPATRSVRVQATVANPAELLRPGMFVNVAVLLPEETQVLTVPATAVLHAPYSDSVFVVEDSQDEKAEQGGKVLRQQFVRLGEKRGDFVALLTGVEEGEVVASTGVFKLRNGEKVVIDNSHAPDFQLRPEPENN